MWTGSLFDCPSGVIILRHTAFSREDGSESSGECNNGALTARGIGVITTNSTPCFVSQLRFSANILIENNSTIECVRDDGISETIVDMTTATITTGIILLYYLHQL